MQCDDRTIIIFRTACFPAPTTPDLPPICPVFPVSISAVTAVSAATLTAAAASVFTSTYRNDTSSKHTSTPLSEAPNFRHFLHPMRRNRRIKQCENTLGRSHAVHRNMEERPQLAQRNEEIRGKKHYQQHAWQAAMRHHSHTARSIRPRRPRHPRMRRRPWAVSERS